MPSEEKKARLLLVSGIGLLAAAIPMMRAGMPDIVTGLTTGAAIGFLFLSLMRMNRT